MKLQRRTVAVIAIAAGLLCLAIFGLVVWRVERALGGASRNAAAKRPLDVEERTLGAQPNPGFEGISAPAVFKSAAVFQGNSIWPVRRGFRLYRGRSAGAYLPRRDRTAGRSAGADGGGDADWRRGSRSC